MPRPSLCFAAVVVLHCFVMETFCIGQPNRIDSLSRVLETQGMPQQRAQTLAALNEEIYRELLKLQPDKQVKLVDIMLFKLQRQQRELERKTVEAERRIKKAQVEAISEQAIKQTQEYLKQYSKEEMLRLQLSGMEHDLKQIDRLRLTQLLELEKSGAELNKQREENARKKKEIDLLARNMQLQTTLNASLLEREKSTRLYYLSGLVAALLAIAGLYHRYRYKKRTTEQLTSANTQLQSTLDQLTRTQSQLIHAEKMATLGEMTAGIAHEIRNPLNFVNNFSELSSELTEELEALIRDGGPEERRALQAH